MNTRKLDKSKQSNIKCEHCYFYGLVVNNVVDGQYCRKKQEKKNYWNRCKSFQWSEKYKD